MRSQQIVFYLLFVVNFAATFHLRKFSGNRYLELKKKDRDPLLEDYLLGKNRETSDELAAIEYDVDGDIRDFEFQIERLRNSARGLENSIRDELVRREKAVTFDLPRPTAASLESRSVPGMMVRITNHALNYFKEKLMLLVRHDSMRSNLAPIETTILGANVTVDNLNVVEFAEPQLATQNLGGGTLRVTTTEGSAKIRGEYTSVFRTTRLGQFEALIEGFDLDFKMRYLKTFDGRLKVIDHSCFFAVANVSVSLQPELAPEFNEKLRKEIAERMYNGVCPKIEAYLERVGERLSDLITFVNPVDARSNFRQDVVFDSRVLSEPEISKDYAQIELRGEFLSNRTAMEGQPAPLDTSAGDTTRMAYVYVSDFSMNSFLHQLTSFGDIRLNLHVLPEIVQFLRSSCESSEMCIGQYATLNQVDSGRLVVRTRERPRVRFHDGSARVLLKASVELSYSNSEQLLAEEESYLTFDADISLRIDKLEVSHADTHHYAWTAKTEIEKITVMDAAAQKTEMEPLVDHLQSVVNKMRMPFEKLLSNHLRSILPISTSKAIELANVSTEFREHTLVLAFDVSVDAKLFPHFSLVR